MTDKPKIKRKTARLDFKIALELEHYAVEKQVSENALMNRYILEGLRRDKGQTTLDETKEEENEQKENSIKTSKSD